MTARRRMRAALEMTDLLLFQTHELAQQLAHDSTTTLMRRACVRYDEAMSGRGPFHWCAFCSACRPFWVAQTPATRSELASPEQTDNGQCWTEEIFSLL